MKTLRTSEILKNSMFTLLAVEAVELRQNRTSSGCQMFASIKPIAVVVRSGEDTFAIDMEAEPADLDKLRRSIPELATIIPSTRKA